MSSPESAPTTPTNAAARSTRVVAVTGVSGLIGQRLLPLLDGLDGVERVVGLDAREPARRVTKLDFRLVDLRSAELTVLLQDVDTIVHLAGVVGPNADIDLVRGTNVDGTRALLAAAADAGVRKVVRTSSAAVYGAWANNAVPLTEASALRPNPGYEPAIFDAECERLLFDWEHDAPQRVATTLRLAPVVGAGAHTLFARAAAGRPPVVVRGATPPMQVVHVDDVASAIVLAVEQDLHGAFNVAADGWLDHDDALAVAPHRRPPAVPEEVAERALAAMWASGVGEAPPSVLPYLVHSWVVANDAIKAHGWQPKHTNEEAMLLAGDPDARRRPLPWIAAVGALVAGAGGATWWLSRRRRA